jgi:hypothetical protein
LEGLQDVAEMTDEITWVPVSVIAAEYQRSPQMIRNWVRSGLIVEIGFSVRRDITGHFIIGVPTSEFRNFSSQKSQTYQTNVLQSNQ